MNNPALSSEDKKTLETLRRNMLLKLFSNPIFAERKSEIFNTYSYFFGKNISQASSPNSLLIVDPNKRQSLAFTMALEVAQSMGSIVFTNPDYKSASLGDVLVTTIDASLSSSADKIERLLTLPQTTFVNFNNVDNAPALVVSALQKLHSKNPSNIFWAIESKTANILDLGFNVEIIDLKDNAFVRVLTPLANKLKF